MEFPALTDGATNCRSFGPKALELYWTALQEKRDEAQRIELLPAVEDCLREVDSGLTNQTGAQVLRAHALRSPRCFQLCKSDVVEWQV